MKSLDKFENDLSKIDLSLIDRVYSLEFKQDIDKDFIEDLSYYNTHHVNKSVYVKLQTSWCNNCEMLEDGQIFACLKPNTFFNLVLNERMDKVDKFRLLKEDRILLSEIYDKNVMKNNKDSIYAQTLQSILSDENQESRRAKLIHYSDLLPEMVTNTMYDYKDYMEALSVYKEINFEGQKKTNILYDPRVREYYKALQNKLYKI